METTSILLLCFREQLSGGKDKAQGWHITKEQRNSVWISQKYIGALVQIVSNL